MGDSTRATRESPQREALLRQMAHEIPGILWTTDCELRLTSSWGAGLADFNAPPDRAVGITLFERLQIEDLEHPAIAVHRRALQGESVSLEIEWEGRPYQARVAPLRDHEGQIVGCIGVAQDVSERERMRQALQQSEERYRLAVTAARVAIWDWDLETDAVFVDPAGKALQGYEDHEVGNHLDEFSRFVHPDDWDRLLAEGQACLEGRDLRFEAEFRVLHKDGSVRWLAAQGEAVRDADGKPCRMLGTAVDITERRQAEEALRESMARTRALLEAPFDVMLLADTSGIIRDVNQTATRSLQRTPEQLIGTYVYDLFTSPVAQLRKAKAEEVIRTGKPVRFEEEGEGVTFDTTVHPVFDSEGNVVEFVIWGRDITDRKRAEEALRASEEKWRSLVENAPNIILIVDRDGTIRFANRGVPGLGVEEVTGKNIYEYIQPEYHKVVRETIERVFRTGEPGAYEIKGTGPHGRDSWYATQVGPLKHNHNIVAATLITTDVTDRKRTEEDIESLARFPSENPNPVLRIAGHGMLLYANSASQPLLSQWGSQTGAMVPDRWRNIARQSITSGVPSTVELEHGDRTFSFVVTPVTEAGYVNLYGRDVTDRKQAEEALKRAHDELEEHVRERTEELAAANRQLRSEVAERKQAEKALREGEERFRLAFEEGPLGMTIVNEDKQYVRVNRAFCEMLEYSEEELVGKKYTDVTHLEDVDKCVGWHAKGLKGELSRGQFEKRFITKTREIIWARVTGSYVRDRQGRPLYALAMYENITGQKQAEEALRRAERLGSVGTLAAGIAHEINNPLGAIMLSAETALAAKGQADGDEILEKALNNIRAAGLRGGRIVKSMLQFARDEVSEKWLNDLGEVARRATHATRTLANETQVAVQLALPDDLPKLCINPTEMEQVLINLISNAIQASQPGDCVMLRIQPASDSVQIFVEDQGRGMTRTQRSRAFDPFYTTRQQEGGTGLGLSIAHAIVEEHGGTIHSESSPLGGTTMRIVLPIGPAQSQQEDPGKARP